MKKITKKLSIIFPLLILLTVSAFLYFNYAINRHNYDGNTTKVIVIESGMPVSEIGALLEKNDLINSAGLFTLYVRIKKIALQAGSYEIPSNLSLREVVNLLQHGINDVKITFIEGLRVEEIAEFASKKLSNVNYDDFVASAKSQNLEGKLFPDTYFVKEGISTSELIALLSETFDTKTASLFKDNKTGLSDKEVLIIASIVEREEPTPSERPIVAGILISRYKNGELLGVDATVQYISGIKGNWWPKNLTIEQLAIDNPYNTRKLPGLPPEPICNPSLSSINAVLNYQKTPYNYYLHGKDGKVHYAKTLEEHTRNMNLYL